MPREPPNFLNYSSLPNIYIFPGGREERNVLIFSSYEMNQEITITIDGHVNGVLQILDLHPRIPVSLESVF